MDVDVLIIGGGPSGLFTAIQCSTGNNKVIVLEKKSAAGRKLLITGGGQCNLTQAGSTRELLDHYGDNERFIRKSLYRFNNDNLMDFFRERGIKFITTEEGKVFPSSYRAGDILEVLLDECRKRNVILNCSEAVKDIKYTKDNSFSPAVRDNLDLEKQRHFLVKTEKKEYRSRFLVLATGGKSYQTTGSSGDGYEFARSLGHSVIEPRPALTPIYIKNYKFVDLAGISLQNIDISLWRNKKLDRRWSGDILFTHNGLSGPGILNYSRYIRSGDIIKLNLTGINDITILEKELINRIDENGKLLFKNILKDFHLPSRLIDKLLEITGIPDNRKGAQVTKDERKAIISLLYSLPMTVEYSGGFNMAMATTGGINLKEINSKTMESRIVSNLFAVGEVLDIDGDTGGYNLQAAFSTGFTAGQTILEKNKNL